MSSLRGRVRPDGTMRPHVMRLSVTADDIRLGQRRSAHQCPIAYALRRRGLVDVRVGEKTAYVGEPVWFASARLSRRARDFVALFDEDGTASPATFVLHWRRLDD